MRKLTKKERKDLPLDLNDHFTAEFTKEYKDGSARLTVTYDDVMKKVVRTIYKKKRCTKKLMKQFVLEGIDAGIKKEQSK